MVILETPTFTKRIQGLIPDTVYQDLQNALIVSPEIGDIIQGSGGIRKVRWNVPGRGKRGGIRVLYYWIVEREQIYMLIAYAKNECSDLTKDQLAILKKLVEDELGNG